MVAKLSMQDVNTHAGCHQCRKAQLMTRINDARLVCFSATILPCMRSNRGPCSHDSNAHMAVFAMNGGSTCDVFGLGPDNALLEVIHSHHPLAAPLGHLDSHLLLLLLLLGGSSGLLLHHLPAHTPSSSRLQNSVQGFSNDVSLSFSAVLLSHLLLCGL